MTRLGYAIVSCIMLFLVYYLTLAADPDALVRIFPKPLSASFELKTESWHQVINGETLLVNDVNRQVVPSKVANLAKFLKKINAHERDIIADITPAMLPDYGLDGSNELRYAEQRYRWAIVNKQAYIWHEQEGRIYKVRTQILEQLATYSKRFDNDQLIDSVSHFAYLEFDGLILERVSQYGGWLAINQPQRPAFNTRGADMLEFLRKLSLESVLGVELSADATPVWNFKAKILGGDSFELDVFQHSEQYFLRAGKQPVQRLHKRKWQELNLLRDAFKKDYLVDIFMGMEGIPFDRMVIKSGGVEKYRFERHGTEDGAYQVPGYSYWELIWPGGRESASPQIAARFFYGLNSLAVEDVHFQPVNAPLLPNENTLSVYCFDGEENQKCVVHWSADGMARSQFHTGKIAPSDEGVEPLLSFETLKDPSNFLNPFILPADPRRIEKIQRLHYGTEFRGELLKRQSLNSWTLGRYTAQKMQTANEVADATACNRIALALVNIQAEEVRFVDAAFLAQCAQPERGLDVRLSAWDIKNGEDDQFLEETLARDWGISLKNIDNQWWAMNRDETVAYRIHPDDLEQLFAAVEPGYIFAGAPGQIDSMRIVYDQTGYELKRAGDHWQTQRNRQWLDVDQLQMRQYMRYLTQCRAQTIDKNVAEIAAAGIIAELHIYVPGLEDRREHITIKIGSKKDELYPVCVMASSGSQDLNGVAWCPAAQVEVLLKKQQWFLPLQQDALLVPELNKSEDETNAEVLEKAAPEPVKSSP